MNAMTLACALGGRRTGSHWMAPCPAHEDKSPSLSIRDTDDGKILVHCHAGCDQSVVIGELRSRGLWDSASNHCRQSAIRRSPAASSLLPTLDDSGRTTAALRLWASAGPAVDTFVPPICNLGELLSRYQTRCASIRTLGIQTARLGQGWSHLLRMGPTANLWRFTGPCLPMMVPGRHPSPRRR